MTDLEIKDTIRLLEGFAPDTPPCGVGAEALRWTFSEIERQRTLIAEISKSADHALSLLLDGIDSAMVRMLYVKQLERVLLGLNEAIDTGCLDTEAITDVGIKALDRFEDMVIRIQKERKVPDALG